MTKTTSQSDSVPKDPPVVVVDAKSHYRSSVALCSSVFVMFYLGMSVFPYMGFMVMQLVPGLDRETVGTKVGFLVSSFMMGRTLTAYMWGRLADVYGRKFVLVVTLIVSAVGAFLFGCSTSYKMAIIVRFIMGFGNGTMVVSRTVISELAKGDKELETKGVAILMSVNGLSMLICPSVGGFLAEPLQQYPSLTGGALDPLLTKFPFLLPNLVASLLALISMTLVVVFVEETLPEHRHWSHLGTDLLRYLISFFSNQQSTSPKTPSCSTTDPEIATESTHLTTNCKSNNSNKQQPQKVSPHSFQAIMNETLTRAYLMAAWCNHFAAVCNKEAFPLFAMSVIGGLGMDETWIAAVGTLAGVWFLLFQNKIFTWVIKHYGLVRSQQVGSFSAIIPIALVPFSTLLPNKKVQLAYLSIVTAAQTIARSIFFGSNTIGVNRTVEASRRAAMNGVSSTGTGLARALGPTFSGWLLALSLNSNSVVPPELGGWVAYSVVAIVGLGAYWSTLPIPLMEDE